MVLCATRLGRLSTCAVVWSGKLSKWLQIKLRLRGSKQGVAVIITKDETLCHKIDLKRSSCCISSMIKNGPAAP